MIGNSSRDDKLEQAAALGLDVGINYTTHDVVEEVMKVTDGRGVDVVYEHVGGELFQKGLDSLTKDGRLVICGGHGGEVVPFDIIPFFRRQLSVIGSFVFTRAEVETCFRLIAQGALRATDRRHVPARAGPGGDRAAGEPRLLREDRADHGRWRMKRIGVDVGGTFTDLIYVDDESGTVLVHKLPTTPDDPSQGTVQGIRELTSDADADPAALDQVFHGTTIATNIVIEHNGATVGLITTEGYRDILHIARHKKPLNFSNYQDLPWQRYPIVRRRYRLTVPERISRDGDGARPARRGAGAGPGAPASRRRASSRSRSASCSRS